MSRRVSLFLVGVLGIWALLGIGASAFAQVPITEAVVEALKQDQELDQEALRIALNEVIPAMQADPEGPEAKRVEALCEALCRGGVMACEELERQWAAHDHSLHPHPDEPLERERPEREPREHDHSSHNHGDGHDHRHEEES